MERSSQYQDALERQKSQKAPEKPPKPPKSHRQELRGKDVWDLIMSPFAALWNPTSMSYEEWQRKKRYPRRHKRKTWLDRIR